MSFMEMQIFKRGRLASCECSKCGTTKHWHEWASDGQADDLKLGRCDDCGSPMDASTYWESRSRNWYAGWYSAPGYLDCTSLEFGTNLRKLKRELRSLYGEEC